MRIGADPLGGASVQYWEYIAEHLGLDLTVVNPKVDPTWAFMTLDTDGKIRMDCSSPNAMASLIKQQGRVRHLHRQRRRLRPARHRHPRRRADEPERLPRRRHLLPVRAPARAGAPTPAIGKTLVSSSMINRVAEDLGRTLLEVPVGFKWFVPGLRTGEIAFGGEESAGASFLALDGSTWTTDKDGILLALLASEIKGVTGRSPERALRRPDREARHARRTPASTPRPTASRRRSWPSSTRRRSPRPSSPASRSPPSSPAPRATTPPIGGLKVTTESAWFAARPSGTEDVYKIYAESFRGPEHLAQVQEAAREVVSAALA